MTQKEDKFNIVVPIDIGDSLSKSEERNDGEWYVQGYATTPDLDLQGDIVLPTGVDTSYFMTKGFINYEHKSDAEFIIGVPTDNSYVDLKKGLFVEAKLFPDNQHAQAMWNLAHMIQKAESNRTLGFSIEGAVIARDDFDKRVIKEVAIQNVALTTHPANPEATWETLVKSWATGHSVDPNNHTGSASLRRAPLSSTVTDLTNAVRIVSQFYGMYSDEEKDYVIREVNNNLEHEADKSKEDYGQVVLQLFGGASYDDAWQFLHGTSENGIGNNH